MLPGVLRELFPELVEDAGGAYDTCWIVKAHRRNWRDLDGLSGAAAIVDEFGNLDVLKRKLKREHPLLRNRHDRPNKRAIKRHCNQDVGFINCLTEATAFAWVTLRDLGTPRFVEKKGAPDIRVDQKYWVEAKAKLPTGAWWQGPPPPHLLNRQFHRAIKQFMRQESRQNNIVFLNLYGILDVSWEKGHSERSVAPFVKWAEMKELEFEALGVTVVICSNFDWKNPIRDPWAA